MSQRYEKGMQALRRHLGPDADKYIAAIEEVAPLFAKVNVEFAYGDIYNDENRVLDDKTKELTTIAALTVMGNALPQLKLHIEAALRCGATQQEIVEVITQMLAYCGFPAATNAIMAAKQVFNS
jgi:4-carboxymuconolactone decarboxylase